MTAKRIIIGPSFLDIIKQVAEIAKNKERARIKEIIANKLIDEVDVG